jgi:hypothetical protein
MAETAPATEPPEKDKGAFHSPLSLRVQAEVDTLYSLVLLSKANPTDACPQSNHRSGQDYLPKGVHMATREQIGKMKFFRPKGFGGSIPRNWIDKTLPICPFCGKRSEWEESMKMGVPWNSYYFRCSNDNCMIVLSIPVPDVVPRGISTITLLRKQNKTMKFEDYGNNEQLKSKVDRQYQIEELQKRTPQQSGAAEPFCGKCGSQLAGNEAFCPQCGAKRNA